MMVDETFQAVEVKSADVPFASSGFEAPTIFADDIRGAGVIAGAARLNLVENRVDPNTGNLTARIVCVLVVPVEMIGNWGPFLVKHFSKEALAEQAGPDQNA